MTTTTPITDAEIIRGPYLDRGGDREYVPADICREIETRMYAAESASRVHPVTLLRPKTFGWHVVDKHGYPAPKGFSYEYSADLVVCADDDHPANAPHRAIKLIAHEERNGCYCQPGKCMAPKIMGRQQPCLDPEKAGKC